MTTLLSTLNRYEPFFVGFDKLFDQMSTFELPHKNAIHYPPYNIIQNGDDKYMIEVALAGFTQEQIKVTHLPETNKLVIEGANEDKDTQYLHQGISSRKFQRSWTVSDNIEVIDAEFTDGVLRVQLENVIPDEKKPKQIEIK